MNIVASLSWLIMLGLAIALVVVSNMDYGDNQCRSKGLARGVGIFYLVYAGLVLIAIIITLATVGSAAFWAAKQATAETI